MEIVYLPWFSPVFSCSDEETEAWKRYEAGQKSFGWLSGRNRIWVSEFNPEHLQSNSSLVEK